MPPHFFQSNCKKAPRVAKTRINKNIWLIYIGTKCYFARRVQNPRDPVFLTPQINWMIIFAQHYASMDLFNPAMIACMERFFLRLSGRNFHEERYSGLDVALDRCWLEYSISETACIVLHVVWLQKRMAEIMKQTGVLKGWRIEKGNREGVHTHETCKACTAYFTILL